MRKLGRDHIITAEGAKLINFNKMIVLNESAAYLWKETCGKEFSEEDLAAMLVAKYGIDNERALIDAKNIEQAWIDAGIVG